MHNVESEQASKALIDRLQVFLKSWDYGCHMLGGLVEKHLSGEDIVPQVSALYHDDMARGIFYLISCSDERAEAVFGSDLIDEDGRQKLSDIRSKYRPILEDVIPVVTAIISGEINPMSSCRIDLSYEHEEQSVRLDITGYSGQREIFRVVQDALNFIWFPVTIIGAYSDSFEEYQRQGLPLSQPNIKQLERLHKDLQNSTTQLSKVVQKYLSASAAKKAEATSD